MITMIETIANASLAVNEQLIIQKRRITNGKSKKRLSLVTRTVTSLKGSTSRT